MIHVTAMIASDAMFIAFWAVLFDNVGAGIRGYGFTDVMFLWSVAASGVGASVIIFGNSSAISAIIFRGELDV